MAGPLGGPVAGLEQGVLQGLGRRARSTTPFALLAEAVEQLQVRALLRQRQPKSAERALANLDLFLEMAGSYAVRGLGCFAADLRSKWEKTEAQAEGRPDAAEQAVNLITIHSAKGLEWPVVILVNTCADFPGPPSILYAPKTNQLLGKLGGTATAAYTQLKEEEEAQNGREDIRLLYVACTRAAELLVLPWLVKGKSPWLTRVPMGIDQLPELDLKGLSPDLPAPPPEASNTQAPGKFEAEAGEIHRRTRSLTWEQPSRHEGEEQGAEAARETPGEPEQGGAAALVRGGALRGVVMHKLLEEMLTGETPSEEGALVARAGTLLRELDATPVSDPTRGFSPQEMGAALIAIRKLPEIEMLWADLVPEFPVYGQRADPADPRRVRALGGVADAVAVDATGKIRVVIDWKSDVAPTLPQREKYQRQLQTYLTLTGAPRGLLVYLTHQSVHAFQNASLPPP